MAQAGQELTGPGIMLRLVSISPELLEMEASYSGEGGMPPMHLHPSQTERFEVLEGTMVTVIGGTERTYEAGAAFDVPPATPHQMRADGPGAGALGGDAGAPHGRVLRADVHGAALKRGGGRGVPRGVQRGVPPGDLVTIVTASV